MTENEIMSITEAARFLRRTRQSVVVAIKKGLLPAVLSKRDSSYKRPRWYLEKKDIIAYVQNRYCRLKSKDIHGNPIYNPQEGIYSPPMLASVLGVTTQRIYYLMRSGAIPYHKKCFEREKGNTPCILIYHSEIKNLEFISKKIGSKNKKIDLKETPE